MTTVAVIATGQSLTLEQVEIVRQAHAEGRCKAVAVSNAYELAPWADALVSHDKGWWEHHREASKFAGRKFCGFQVHGLEHLPTNSTFKSGSNSGLQAMRVAQYELNATLIALLGFDMHGTHYFGAHPHPLRNTTPQRFAHHIAQFDHWKGCEVVNCSPGSALKKFRTGDIGEVLRT